MRSANTVANADTALVSVLFMRFAGDGGGGGAWATRGAGAMKNMVARRFCRRETVEMLAAHAAGRV